MPLAEAVVESGRAISSLARRVAFDWNNTRRAALGFGGAHPAVVNSGGIILGGPCEYRAEQSDVDLGGGAAAPVVGGSFHFRWSDFFAVAPTILGYTGGEIYPVVIEVDGAHWMPQSIGYFASERGGMGGGWSAGNLRRVDLEAEFGAGTTVFNVYQIALRQQSESIVSSKNAAWASRRGVLDLRVLGANALYAGSDFCLFGFRIEDGGDGDWVAVRPNHGAMFGGDFCFRADPPTAENSADQVLAAIERGDFGGLSFSSSVPFLRLAA